MPSDDEFKVHVANETFGSLTPIGSSLQYGQFASGGHPQTVDIYTGGSLPTAFHVQGTVAAGPQGTVTYDIDSNAMIVFQFNSNVGGAPGAYFYAGIQPREPGADCSGYWVDIPDFPIPAPAKATSFAPDVYLSQTGGDYNCTKITLPSFPTKYNPQIWFQFDITNSTIYPMTLNTLTAPLDVPITDVTGSGPPAQPALAHTVPPGAQGFPLLTMMAAVPMLNVLYRFPSLNMTYNIGSATAIKIGYVWSGTDQPYYTFSGPNSSAFVFSSTMPTFTQETGGGMLVSVSLAIAPAGTSQAA